MHDLLRIVNFHGIGRPQRPLEAGEEPYWLDEDRFLRILDLIVEHRLADTVGITFDDGNASDYHIALPPLIDRGMHARFFVLSGRIGAGGSLGAGEIRALVAAGMAVGSHGVDHLDWTRLSGVDLARQLERSKLALEDLLGAEVDEVAIPFGRYNAAVLRAIHTAGYKRAYSSDGGRTGPRDFPAGRTSIRQDMADAAILDVLDGRAPVWLVARTSIRRAVRRLV